MGGRGGGDGGVLEERAIKMPRELETVQVCWGLGVESRVALSAFLSPRTLEYLKLLIKHLLACRMT